MAKPLTKKEMIEQLKREGFVKAKLKDSDAILLTNPKLPYAFKFEGDSITMVNVLKEQKK